MQRALLALINLIWGPSVSGWEQPLYDGTPERRREKRREGEEREKQRRKGQEQKEEEERNDRKG